MFPNLAEVVVTPATCLADPRQPVQRRPSLWRGAGIGAAVKQKHASSK
jgi:hypothetical protein